MIPTNKIHGPECSKVASEIPNLAGGVRFSPGSPLVVKERKDMTIPDANLNTSKTAGSVRLVLGWANASLLTLRSQAERSEIVVERLVIHTLPIQRRKS